MSNWYDPIELDECFTLFERGRQLTGGGYRIDDDDEFSLPEYSTGGEEEEETEENEGDIHTEQISIIRNHSIHSNSNSSPLTATANAAVNTPSLSSSSPRISPRAKIVTAVTSTATAVQTKRLSESSLNDKTSTIQGSGKLLRNHGDSSGSSMSSSRKYVAGSSMIGKVVKCVDSPATEVEVRQKNYKKLGIKGPSEPSIYEFVALDVIKGRKKICKVYTQVVLPWLTETSSEGGANKLPQVLIINLQVPNKGPQMFRSASDSDPGTSIVFYFKLRPTNVDDAATKLAFKFFSGMVTARFKTMAFVDNLPDLKFPALIAPTINKFNGKPVIVQKTGSFYAEKGIYEVDIDVFQFPVIARTALASAKTSSALARIRLAFVMQGETEDELPERLLGCCEIRNLDLDTCAYDRFN